MSLGWGGSTELRECRSARVVRRLLLGSPESAAEESEAIAEKGPSPGPLSSATRPRAVAGGYERPNGVFEESRSFLPSRASAPTAAATPSSTGSLDRRNGRAEPHHAGPGFHRVHRSRQRPAEQMSRRSPRSPRPPGANRCHAGHRKHLECRPSRTCTSQTWRSSAPSTARWRSQHLADRSLQPDEPKTDDQNAAAS